MTVYPADTSAAVLILYRNHEVTASFDASLNLSRTETITERIKILKESGKDYPDYKIMLRKSTNPVESVKGIKVWTFNKENGKTEIDKLGKKMIFNEKVSENVGAVNFSAQNVRVGSVVEVQYTITSPRVWDIGTIYLQDEYPVNLAEASVKYADCFYFNRMQRGFLPCENDSTFEPAQLLLSGGQSYDFKEKTDTYRAVDVPAIKDYTHCYCPDQYTLSVCYDLQLFNLDGRIVHDYGSTWEKVDEQIQDEKMVKDFYAKSRFDAASVKQALDGAQTEEEQISRIRDMVLANVRFNDTVSAVADAAKAFKEKDGDSADINALVAQALNSAGFKAAPVFLKTRNKGVLIGQYISPSAYNAVVTEVTTPSGKIYYFDASNKYGYLNVLAPNFQVTRGRVVPLKGSGEWVDLSILTRNQLVRKVDIEINPAEGELTGTWGDWGYNSWSYDIKRGFSRADSEEDYISNIERDTGIEVENLELKGKDQWSGSAELSFTFRDELNQSGGLIYVKPFLSAMHTEADFRDAERQIPVEFSYPYTMNYTVNITVPDGYTVESLPQNLVANCEIAGSRVILMSQFDGDKRITVNIRFNINAPVVPAEEYGVLRDYWGRLSSIYNSTVVLKKL